MNDGLLIEQLVRSFLVSKIDSICFYGQFWTGSKKGNIGLFEVDCFWPELGLLVEIKSKEGFDQGAFDPRGFMKFHGRKSTMKQVCEIESNLGTFGFNIVSKVIVLVCNNRTDFCSISTLTEPGTRILRVQLSELNSWF
jgi:hypothetical protein